MKRSTFTDKQGRVTTKAQKDFYNFEDKYYDQLSHLKQLKYQRMLARIGGKLLTHAIEMPLDDTPFWLVQHNELTNYRSAEQLPQHADIVIIGCGLTGSSSAYHLKDSGKTVVVLEEGERPACQSSGKNGGNFQLLSESHIGAYDGIVGERCEVLRMKHPRMSDNELQSLAEEESKIIFRFTQSNLKRFTNIVQSEKFECDFSPTGWLQIANNEHEEESMKIDIDWVKQFPQTKMTLYTANDIQREFQIKATFPGRFMHSNGNYHPYKFVSEVMRCCIKHGVQLFTNTKVKHIIRGATLKIATSLGIIHADKVIVATNAFTPFILPELKHIITCIPSQILNYEHLNEHIQGATVTERGGDIYYNFPKSRKYVDHLDKSQKGMLHFGLDFPNEVKNPYHIERSQKLFDEMVQLVNERFPESVHQPPVRAWSGPMGITPDRTPIIGFLHGNNVIIAAAFQGFGGSWCVQSGYIAAQMALTGKEQKGAPASIFSPKRFLPK